MSPRFPAVVLCGSFRKDFAGLQSAHSELTRLGAFVISPRLDRELAGEVGHKDELETNFVLLAGDSGAPTDIERIHVSFIPQSDFVWLHAPGGYVGPSTAFELGVAYAARKPIFSLTEPHSLALVGFVTVVESLAAAIARASTTGAP